MADFIITPERGRGEQGAVGPQGPVGDVTPEALAAKEAAEAARKAAEALALQNYTGEMRLADVISKGPWVDVRAFGVKSIFEDNLFDNSIFLQQAIDFCNTNKKSLLIPDVYYIGTTLNSKEVSIIGIGNPYIPFLTWDYTHPDSTLDVFWDYAYQCQGSILVTNKNIPIFRTGLVAENLGLFGNRRVNQSGIDLTNGTNKLILRNCVLKGFGSHGINAEYGVISLYIDRCQIEQNGKSGIYVNKNAGDYTGETNRFIVKNSRINRNESHGIDATVMGKGICIEDNSFEANGEPSDSSRSKPTNTDDIVFGCVLNLYNSGMTNGALKFHGNYSEETYGLLKLVGNSPTHGISVKNNFWQPYDQVNYSCGISLAGWLNGVDILSNNFYTAHDYVKFETGNNVKNISIDTKYTGVIARGFTPNVERRYDGSDRTYVNIASNATKDYVKFEAGFVTSRSYNSNADVTYFFLDLTKVGSYDIGVSGDTNTSVGYALIIDDVYVGIVRGYSGTPSPLWRIIGNRDITIGDGSAKLVLLPGFVVVDAGNTRRKIVIDWDGSIFVNGK